MKIVEEEEEEVAEIQPDPLHQLILHFSHNALTERRYIFIFHVSFWQEVLGEKIPNIFGLFKCATFSFLMSKQCFLN